MNTHLDNQKQILSSLELKSQILTMLLNNSAKSLAVLKTHKPGINDVANVGFQIWIGIMIGRQEREIQDLKTALSSSENEVNIKKAEVANLEEQEQKANETFKFPPLLQVMRKDKYPVCQTEVQILD